MCRCELPLTYGGDRPFVEAAAEALEDLHVADIAVARHDDFEQNVAADVAAARLFRELRLHLMQQPRRLDAAAGTVGSAPRTAAGPRADSAAGALAIARPCARPISAAVPRAGAVRVVTRVFD